MVSSQRLSICYVVPGHHLLPSAGPTRNVLSLAEALSKDADVTVAFRRIAQPVLPRGYDVVAIEPDQSTWHHVQDDAAIRGIGLREFIAYVAALRRFTDTYLPRYDIVLEKSWLLSGYVVARCRGRGVPGIIVENIVRVWNEPLRNHRDLSRYARYQFAQALVGRYLRRSARIIAETEELRATLVQRWRLAHERVKAIGLGVDHTLFHPADQAKARRELGISSEAMVLLYVGVLDQTHDLTPVLEAFQQVPDPALALHIVGDGMLRARFEAMAHTSRKRVVFHGRVPHTLIPQYIAAADACLAPYDLTEFPGGQVAYSTLKIPEYLACGRPVVSVPSGHITALIEEGVSGFLFDNTARNWKNFLSACPSRQQLRKMGALATHVVNSVSWETTARAYLEVCQQVLAENQT
jgi:glycosyltransferase involved in cell wall biosynthesis